MGIYVWDLEGGFDTAPLVRNPPITDMDTIMLKSRTMRLLGTAVACLLGYGCLEPTATETTLPFDPNGSWEAQVQGLVSDLQVDGPMVITLSVFEVFSSLGGGATLVELTGGWEWGGFAGSIDGFWTPSFDATAKFSGGVCPTFPSACSVTLFLNQPSDSCARIVADLEQEPIPFLGWFDGPTTLTAASLLATFWEGAVDDPQPCPGPVLISLDTDASFTRN